MNENINSKPTPEEVRENICMNCFKVHNCEIYPNDLMVENHTILEAGADENSRSYTCDEFKLAGITFNEDSFTDDMKALAAERNIVFGKFYKLTEVMDFLFALDSLRMKQALILTPSNSTGVKVN